MKTKSIKVQYSTRYQTTCTCLPKIQMEGRWLAELGFDIGTRLMVEYEAGSIRLRPLTAAELAEMEARERQKEVQNRLKELRLLTSETCAFPRVAETPSSYGRNA